MRKDSRYHYSGESTGSRQFWGRVKAIEDDSDHSALYSLGCVLQNIEEYVQGQLANAEVKQKCKQGHKKKKRASSR